MIVHIGITATRKGMSEKQQTRLANVFRDHLKRGNQVVLHHGDCIGGDEQADAIARSVGREYPDSVMIIIHPPVNDKYRAFCCQEGDKQYPPKTYLARDCDIVDAVDEMYGGPRDHTKEEFRGSGTWTTIRYARERMKRYKHPYKLEILER